MALPGTPELPEVLADPVVGYIAERVYDKEPRSSFSFNCGEFLGGIHDQSDNGSITLFAGEVPLLIDSGAANDPEEGSPSSSYGHNLVLIDGRGQIPSGKGVGCTGRIVHAERHPQATVITADLTAAYTARGYNLVHHAIRHCVFAKRPFAYLLVVDDFCRPRGERAVFEQLFHTPPSPSPRAWMVSCTCVSTSRARPIRLRFARSMRAWSWRRGPSNSTTRCSSASIPSGACAGPAATW